jgi:hypothetical protein
MQSYANEMYDDRGRTPRPYHHQAHAPPPQAYPAHPPAHHINGYLSPNIPFEVNFPATLAPYAPARYAPAFAYTMHNSDIRSVVPSRSMHNLARPRQQYPFPRRTFNPRYVELEEDEESGSEDGYANTIDHIEAMAREHWYTPDEFGMMEPARPESGISHHTYPRSFSPEPPPVPLKSPRHQPGFYRARHAPSHIPFPSALPYDSSDGTPSSSSLSSTHSRRPEFPPTESQAQLERALKARSNYGLYTAGNPFGSARDIENSPLYPYGIDQPDQAGGYYPFPACSPGDEGGFGQSSSEGRLSGESAESKGRRRQRPR